VTSSHQRFKTDEIPQAGWLENNYSFWTRPPEAVRQSEQYRRAIKDQAQQSFAGADMNHFIRRNSGNFSLARHA